MILTQTWDKASRLLCANVLTNKCNIFQVTGVTTTEFMAAKNKQMVAYDIPCLLQSISLPTADGGFSVGLFSIKLPPYVNVAAGYIIQITDCSDYRVHIDSDFNVESVNMGGLKLITKCVCRKISLTDFQGG